MIPTFTPVDGNAVIVNRNKIKFPWFKVVCSNYEMDMERGGY
jgi:hypothetical protein